MADPAAQDDHLDEPEPRDGIDVGDLAGLALIAPVLVATRVARCVPTVVSGLAGAKQRVEQQVAVARMVGQMTTTVVEKKLRERWSATRPGDDATGSGPEERPAATASPGVAGSSPATGVTPPVTPELRVVVDEPSSDHTAPLADELPLDDYESLAASQVVRRLADLDADELELIERFERANRQRRTVLGKIDQLRAT